MSPTIDKYRDARLKFLAIDSNEISDLEKIWSELNEYILDTLDYLQLHQEDLREFYELAENCLTQIDENQLAQQIELLDQKGELLLHSSPNHSNPNPIDNLVENVHRHYEDLIMKITNQSDLTIEELARQLDELDVSMNELSELIVSSTTDLISAEPRKLSEQILDNIVVKNELDKRQISLEQIQTKLNRIEFESIESLLI